MYQGGPTHPFAGVAIATVFNTKQARRLEGHDSYTLALETFQGLASAAGLDLASVDGVFGSQASRVTYALGLGPVWTSDGYAGIPAVIEAAALVAAGVCTTVVVLEGRAGVYTDRRSTAPWTRPANEFVLPFGMYTAVEFALVARRHMQVYGTTPEQIASVSATIRNNGHVNPDAVYYGRGPYTVDDILASRMVADPFHLLDCAMTAEGGCGMIVTTAERAADLVERPIYIHGGSSDSFGPAYQHAPAWDLRGRVDGVVNGEVGRRASQAVFEMAGLTPSDVDCCEFYDPFAFEVIRQLEAHGFCKAGEGGPYVLEGNIGPGGELPVTTDGGTMSYSHGGAQLLQRATRGVEQLRGTCASGQVDGAEIALCTNGGAGALFNDVLLLGSNRP
jgi:acetyl-CoA acetyltransferase